MPERRSSVYIVLGYMGLTVRLDPLMSECLIYQLKPGTTMVRRERSNITSD
jgi:hypothetical protein